MHLLSSQIHLRPPRVFRYVLINQHFSKKSFAMDYFNSVVPCSRGSHARYIPKLISSTSTGCVDGDDEVIVCDCLCDSSTACCVECSQFIANGWLVQGSRGLESLNTDY